MNLKRLIRGNWWDRPSVGRRPRCDHEWTRAAVRKSIAGRGAVVVNGICRKCGREETLESYWVDREPTAQSPVTVTLSRREYDAILRNLPVRGTYGPNGCDLADARATLEAAGRGPRLVA